MPLIEKGGDRTVKILRWIARVITIIVIVYSLTMVIGYSISDPHAENDEFPWFIFVLFPTLLGMILAWRWEKVGGILVIIGGICMGITVLVTAGSNILLAASFISAPFIITGILFLGAWYRREKILNKGK